MIAGAIGEVGVEKWEGATRGEVLLSTDFAEKEKGCMPSDCEERLSPY